MLFAAELFSAVSCAQTVYTSRYFCTFPDGATRLVATNIGSAFPESTILCTPELVEVEKPELSPQATSKLARATLIDGTNLARNRLNNKSSTPVHTFMPSVLAAQIELASARQQLDPRLVGALIYVESRYRSDAVSPKGAIGLMQVMPATARRYGINTAHQLFDPAINLDVGTRYLRDLHLIYGQRLELVLAAYNAGEGAVARYGHAIPPYPETRAYVAKIGSLLSLP